MISTKLGAVPPSSKKCYTFLKIGNEYETNERRSFSYPRKH
jgi:hypothetical protein